MNPKSKVIKFDRTGGPEVLYLKEEIVPSLKDDDILIEHKAIGINYIETYYRTGLYPLELPSGLGTEASGVVLEVGHGVHHLRVGDRVAYAQGPLGSYSERRVIPAKFVVKIPDEISFEEAAGMMLKGLTVQYLLRQTYKVEKGETILFQAAAGGVGLLACQWARHLGVKLIGTVSSDEKARQATEMGAWKTIDYTREDVAKKVLEFTDGKKVKVVYDSVGKSTWESSLDCLSERGLMVNFGNTSGAVTGVELNLLARKGSLYVTRPLLTTYTNTLEKLQAAADELFSLVSSKVIKIPVNKTFNLSDAALAHEHIQGKNSTGSTILLP